ncbi:Uncharacterised protein [Mycobacteroides abscessus subsp. bolletii]|nr:Uncharacterised protein [Mycobacteroides abscessus subsp. bolletii]SKH09459.1 Uncharacterised protein [Mycobacteroides abscessus subsp. bolletii]
MNQIYELRVRLSVGWWLVKTRIRRWLGLF